MQRTTDLIDQHLSETAEQVGLQLAELHQASQVLTQTLLSDQRAYTAGLGSYGAIADILSNHFLTGLEFERPALPVSSLGKANLFTGISASYNRHEIFSRQINALGHQGDCLVLFSGDQHESAMIQAVNAAHDRGMKVIALTRNQNELRSVLLEDDIELNIHTDSHGRAQEIFLLLANLLCDLVEQQLFANEE